MKAPHFEPSRRYDLPRRLGWDGALMKFPFSHIHWLDLLIWAALLLFYINKCSTHLSNCHVQGKRSSSMEGKNKMVEQRREDAPELGTWGFDSCQGSSCVEDSWQRAHWQLASNLVLVLCLEEEVLVDWLSTPSPSVHVLSKWRNRMENFSVYSVKIKIPICFVIFLCFIFNGPGREINHSSVWNFPEASFILEWMEALSIKKWMIDGSVMCCIFFL